MTVRRAVVRDVTDLGKSWSDHPVLRADVPRYRDAVAWSTEQAVALTVAAGESGRRALIGLGEPHALADLVASDVATAGRASQAALGPGAPAVVSLTRGAWDLLPDGVRERLAVPRVSHWDWMLCTAAPPPQLDEDSVIELDPVTDRVAMAALQGTALPHSYTSLDKPATRWFGWRDGGGALRCMAAASDWEAEVHLGSIATHPDVRRRGLGSAVTAAVTRLGLAATGQVSLALYADNHDARRVYERLGFTLVQEWESRRPADA
ncbi:GNAT family N-acetyltransferase [Ruania halotolerans]|uniref:GNAT family N-acetyltransferase n=1 Tax=Ruania halotolerans TaxID=2897773 RepID=UPI001E6591F2|nr:GNAT family N-acetyltransferase [Ruania halotolerans]UFU04752.1 GNAT family N-acetyltransferase [Ruania halotolerans]